MDVYDLRNDWIFTVYSCRVVVVSRACRSCSPPPFSFNCYSQSPPPQRAEAMRGLVQLPGCTDGVPIALPDCSQERITSLEGNGKGHRISAHANHGVRLCLGVKALLSASCEQLGNSSFMREAIGAIGMVPDSRHDRLYGAAAKYMVHSSLPNAGLWQDPQQLAVALIELAARNSHVGSYVEVGVYTAWSTCTIAAYFTRAAASRHRPAGFHGFAVDVSRTNVHPTAEMLLEHLNVKFSTRADFDAHVLPAHRGVYDLCFIDADHAYAGVRLDFARLAHHCKVKRPSTIGTLPLREHSHASHCSRPQRDMRCSPPPPLGGTVRHVPRHPGHVDAAGRQHGRRGPSLLASAPCPRRSGESDQRHPPVEQLPPDVWDRASPARRQGHRRAG
jgi:hypothetical protein